MLRNIILIFNTVRYLKLTQIFGRLVFFISKPTPSLKKIPDVRFFSGNWVITSCRALSLTGPCEFKFLNETGSLSDVGWDGSLRSKLWRYNQHYFDDLNASNANARMVWHLQLIEKWIFDNPPFFGTGWEPYPISLRVVNWIKYYLSGNVSSDIIRESLAIQIRQLKRSIEWHLLGNHLFANAKALVFAGLFFDGKEARKWLNTGLHIISKELSEQVLADGGNFERSPMYHAIFLEDILDLINLDRAYPGEIAKEHVFRWRETASKMLRWLEAMCHPDGEIAIFNDAAIGIAPSLSEIRSYAKRLAIFNDYPVETTGIVSMTQFAESGYIRLDTGNTVALLDVAPIGPDYLPGHAHADTLSFELSVFGQRVITNGGTSRYGLGPERLRERQTVSHSTVEIDGQSSSEVWSGFRVARRAYPFDLAVSECPDVISVACSHDGYKRLPGKPVHRRSWRFSTGYMEVVDSVLGGGGLLYRATSCIPMSVLSGLPQTVFTSIWLMAGLSW